MSQACYCQRRQRQIWKREKTNLNFEVLQCLMPVSTPALCQTQDTFYSLLIETQRHSAFVVALVQLLSHVQLFATPWAAACQAPLCSTANSPGVCSNSCPLHLWCCLTIYLTLCYSFLLRLQSFPPSAFSNEYALCVKWPKY